MATNSVSMALPLNSFSIHNKLNQPNFLKPLSLPPILPKPNKNHQNQDSKLKKNGTIKGMMSLKEKAVAAGITAASMVVPEVANAAGNDFSPSLKNFLLSIVAGGVVLVAILGAVIAVSNFDPVKRA